MFLRVYDSREPQWELLSACGKTWNGAEPPINWPVTRISPGRLLWLQKRTQNNVYNNPWTQGIMGELQGSNHKEERTKTPGSTWVHFHLHDVGTIYDATHIITAVRGQSRGWGSTNGGLKASLEIKQGPKWKQEVWGFMLLLLGNPDVTGTIGSP